ncbi:hypothetical protein TKK_0008376 [Trichogramma kaykai]
MDKTKSSGEKVNFEIDVKLLPDYDGAKYHLDLLENPNGLDPVTDDSPLHAALFRGSEKIAELLLRRGTDPNLTNMIGWTPLHIVCRWDNDLAEKFLKICDEVQKTVQIDVVDKLGYTPLRLAVSNFLPNHVKMLLDRGADLSGFSSAVDAGNVMDVVEHLENGGYDLDESDALSIMKLFDEYELFEESSVDLVNGCRDDGLLAKETKRMRIFPAIDVAWVSYRKPDTTPSLTLYDFIHLANDEATRVMKREYYLGFALLRQQSRLLPHHSKAVYEHLCEKMLRGFFRCWAKLHFMQLIRNALPFECCEMIIDNSTLTNRDLYHICLAAKGEFSCYCCRFLRDVYDCN